MHAAPESGMNDASNGPGVGEQGLLRLIVEGYKCFRDRQEFELAPLTLLAGANSSGKSSAIQPLLLLKQTIEAPFDPGPLKIDGPLVCFDYFAEMFWSAPGTAAPPRVVFGLQGAGRQVVEEYRLADHGALLEGDNAAAWGPFRGPLDRLAHLPGLRGNPDRAYPVIPRPSGHPGPFGREYTAGHLWAWQSSADARLVTVAEQLAALGLTGALQLRQTSDVAVRLLVGRLPFATAGEYLVSIADVGVGVAQVLPVLVALLAASPGQIVHIEQPELHLHPAAQAALAGILVEAARRGVRVVAETHSPLLLLACQALVADGALPADQVRLYFFEREADGAAKVTPGQMDERGAYRDWPVDFAAVELRVQRDYLDKYFERSRRGAEQG